MTYLPIFKAQGNAIAEKMKLIGNILLVEKVDQGEIKTKSGLIMAAGNSRDNILAAVPRLVRVLAKGAGYFTETDDGPKEEPLETPIGAILLVGEASVKWLGAIPGFTSYEPYTMGIVRDEEQQIRWEDDEQYQQTFDLISRGVDQAKD